jgi:hypothetical protein
MEDSYAKEGSYDGTHRENHTGPTWQDHEPVP